MKTFVLGKLSSLDVSEGYEMKLVKIILKAKLGDFFIGAKSPKLRVSKGKFHQKSSKLVNNYDCHSGKWRTWMWNVMEYPWTSQTARSALDLASNYAKHLGLLEML